MQVHVNNTTCVRLLCNGRVHTRFCRRYPRLPREEESHCIDTERVLRPQSILRNS